MREPTVTIGFFFRSPFFCLLMCKWTAALAFSSGSQCFPTFEYFLPLYGKEVSLPGPPCNTNSGRHCGVFLLPLPQCSLLIHLFFEFGRDVGSLLSCTVVWVPTGLIPNGTCLHLTTRANLSPPPPPTCYPFPPTAKGTPSFGPFQFSFLSSVSPPSLPSF